MKTVATRVPNDTFDKIADEARRRGLSRGALQRMILCGAARDFPECEYVEDHEKTTKEFFQEISKAVSDIKIYLGM